LRCRILSDPFFENIFESSNERFDMPNALPVISWGGQQLNSAEIEEQPEFSFWVSITGNRICPCLSAR
jgi:hypothetical protein